MSDTKRRRGIVLVPLEPKPEAQSHGSRHFGCLLSIGGLCRLEGKERKIVVKDLEVEGCMMVRIASIVLSLYW
jgi:hypothetical protein